MKNDYTDFSLEELKKISDTIAMLHDDNLTLSEYITSFLDALQNQVFFDKGDFMFFYYDPESNRYELKEFVPVFWDKKDIDAYVSTFMHMDDVLPVLSQQRPMAFRNNDFFSKEQREKTSYYKEFVVSAQLEISIDANIPLKNSNLTVIMGLFRNSDRKEFTLKELELIKIYQQHLSKGMERFFNEQSPSSNFDLERFDAFGVAILDAHYNLQSYNSVFRQFACTNSELIEDSELYQNIKSLSKQLSEGSETTIGFISINIGDVMFMVEVSEYDSTKGSYCSVVYSISDIFTNRLTELKDQYGISDREYEVLYLMLKDGLSNKEIAEELFISAGTVKRHLYSAYQKMNITSQKQLLNILKIF